MSTKAITVTELPAKLSAALVRAQGRARGVGKSSRNEHGRFDYTSAEEMLHMVGPVLAEEGIAVLAFDRRIDGEWTEVVVKTSKGARSMLYAKTVTTIAIIHESGETALATVELPALAEGARPHDKAVLAAYTEASGYAVRDVGLVARGELDISGRAEVVPVREAATPTRASARDVELDRDFAAFTEAMAGDGLTAGYEIYCLALGKPPMVEMRAWNSPARWREVYDRAVAAPSGDIGVISKSANDLLSQAARDAGLSETDAFAALRAAMNRTAGGAQALDRAIAAWLIAERATRKPRETFKALGVEAAK